MTSSHIIEDARVARVRELKTELAAAKGRLAQAEADRDALVSHLHLALMALHDFEGLPPDGNFRIIDGWNAILRCRNVSKLTSENISKLKADYLANLGIVPLDPTPSPQPSTLIWIIFDGPEENSFCSGRYRVTYTGGTGLHRADRMILDYIHAVKLLGLDTSRIDVETGDKALQRRVSAAGAHAEPPAVLPHKSSEP